MNQPFVITIDKGVNVPPTVHQRSVFAQNRDTLIAMEIGDSFFQENGTREDVANLIRYAKRHLVHLQAFEVEEDEVYSVPGVRVVRVEQEDLPGRKPTTVAPPEDNRTYWINRKSKKRYVCEPGIRPEDAKAVQISKAEFDLDANNDKPVQQVIARFFHHPESNSVFETSDMEYVPEEGVTEVEEAAYLSLKTQYEAGSEYSYWKSKTSSLVVQYLPGRHPAPSQGLEYSNLEEYQKYQNTQVPFTYWKKVNGEYVKVPLAKLQNAYRTPGAVQVTVNEYNDWLKAQAEEDL